MQKYSGDDLIYSPEPDFLCDANWFFLGIFFQKVINSLKFWFVSKKWFIQSFFWSILVNQVQISRKAAIKIGQIISPVAVATLNKRKIQN